MNRHSWTVCWFRENNEGDKGQWTRDRRQATSDRRQAPSHHFFVGAKSVTRAAGFLANPATTEHLTPTHDQCNLIDWTVSKG